MVNEPATVRVDLHPSRLITFLLVGVHAATLIPLWWSAQPTWAGFAIAAAIFIHGVWAIRRFGLLRSARSVIGVALQPGGRCALRTGSGMEFSGNVDASTVVLGSLVVLAVRVGEGHLACRTIIAPDMIGKDDFRSLRIVLKWGRTQESSGSPV